MFIPALAQEAETVCLEIMILDVNGISQSSIYESSPLSTNPNTINICEPGTFEISDGYPSVVDGTRCLVPPAESGNPEQYLLYLISSNPNAALPTPGTILPQATGDWNVVLNASNIPIYDQNNFPPFNTGYFNSFTISTPGTYAIIGAICELDQNSNYVIITSNVAQPTDPVSNKIFLNFIDTGTPLTIDGDQHLCEGASDIYSIPAYLAGLNPQWTVSGGTFTGSGSSIQVNWTFAPGAIGTVSARYRCR
ncbi:MAG: hypothetical protein ACK417_01710 [Bacteroidia bacterium]